MASNIFEGARRITKILAALWIIGISLAASNVVSYQYNTCFKAMPFSAEIMEQAKNDKNGLNAIFFGGDDIAIGYADISKCNEIWTEGKWWPHLLKDLGMHLSWVIMGLLFLWVFTWSIGWVVRGFKGIPKGQDKK